MTILERRIKIFKRACKDSGCFGYKDWMNYIIEKFLGRRGGETFFGRTLPSPPNINEYACQLLFLKMSAENKILTKKGTYDSLMDTLSRYNYKDLKRTDNRIYNDWKEICNFSDKEEIKELIIEYSKHNGQYKKYMEYKDMMDGILNYHA